MNNMWRSDRATCDLCTGDISDAPFVDGRMRSRSSWALMCLTCFTDHGAGLGGGVGQLYGRDGVKLDPPPAPLVLTQPLIVCPTCGEDLLMGADICPVCHGVVH